MCYYEGFSSVLERGVDGSGKRSSSNIRNMLTGHAGNPYFNRKHLRWEVAEEDLQETDFYFRGECLLSGGAYGSRGEAQSSTPSPNGIGSGQHAQKSMRPLLLAAHDCTAEVAIYSSIYLDTHGTLRYDSVLC